MSNIDLTCRLLVAIFVACWFENSFDPDQDRQNVGPDLDLSR